MLSKLLRACFGILTGFATAAAVAATPQVPPASAAVPAALGQQYVKPHQLIDVGRGRKINLFCMGNGPATVLFDSGLSDWSNTWVLIQPEIAKKARACSYDRAGMGYSDPAPGARTPRAIVDDMHAMLEGAKIAGPVVLVGHSLGGFNVKLYSALYPDNVAGIVLVDPSEERLYERGRDGFRAKYGAAMASKSELFDNDILNMLMEKFSSCAATAAQGDLDPASDRYKKCTDPVRTPLGPDILAERPRIQKTAAYQSTQANELANSVFVNRSGDGVYAGLFTPAMFGDKPMIVLTSSKYDKADPASVADHELMVSIHRQTAGLSRRGTQRDVEGSGHNIQVEKPQAIIDAVNEVLKAVGGA